MPPQKSSSSGSSESSDMRNITSSISNLTLGPGSSRTSGRKNTESREFFERVRNLPLSIG